MKNRISVVVVGTLALTVGCTQEHIAQTIPSTPIEETEQYSAITEFSWTQGPAKIDARLESTPAGRVLALVTDANASFDKMEIRFADLEGNSEDWLEIFGTPSRGNVRYEVPYEYPEGTGIELKVTSGENETELARWVPKVQ